MSIEPWTKKHSKAIDISRRDIKPIKQLPSKYDIKLPKRVQNQNIAKPQTVGTRAVDSGSKVDMLSKFVQGDSTRSKHIIKKAKKSSVPKGNRKKGNRKWRAKLPEPDTNPHMIDELNKYAWG